MKKMRWFLFLIMLLIVGLTIIKIVYHQFSLNVYDDFEASRLNKIWTTERMVSSSYEIQSKIVRNGKRAAKITVRYGDKAEPSNGIDKATERDELLESRLLYAVEDIKYEYQFSMFLPDSFPILPVRLVLAQWRQDCPFCDCNKYNPILALRYVSGRLFITLQIDSVRHLLYELNEEIRGRWLDFRFEVKFSKQNNGEVIAFLNEKEIINYKGVTSYSNNCRILSAKNKYYFKMGLYRDRIYQPMTIYLDEYRKRKID